MMDGEGAAESAAGICFLHFDQAESRHLTKKLPWLVDNPPGPQMTGVMVGNFL